MTTNEKYMLGIIAALAVVIVIIFLLVFGTPMLTGVKSRTTNITTITTIVVGTITHTALTPTRQLRLPLVLPVSLVQQPQPL